MFEIGDKVTDTRYGKGIVFAVNTANTSYRPISVGFETGIVQWYTEDGKRIRLDEEPAIVKI